MKPADKRLIFGNKMEHASETTYEVTIYLLQICEWLTWQRKGVTLLELKT